MFGRRNLRFLFSIGLVVALLVIVLILIFNHGGKPLVIQAPLSSYSSDPSAQVAMLIDGPVNADSEHNQVQVIISNNTSVINVFRGYNDTLINSKAYSNNEAAFHVFLRALEYAEFTYGQNSPLYSEASGYCPLGDRYIFTFNVDGNQKERYWTTNCSGLPHSFDGNLALTMQLFEAQIPDYNTITENLNI